MSVAIRRAKEDDIPAMQALERDAAQAFRAIGYDFCADGAVRDEAEHRRGLDEGALFVAEAGGRRAGFILVWRIDGHAHIAEVSVAQAFQRRGIGRMLITAAEDWARDAGDDCITLTTFRDVPWNAPFYASLGYDVFTPGPDETGIAAAQQTEAAFGFGARPRVAMKKLLQS